MSKNIIVTGDRVLIIPDEGKEQTDAGLDPPQGVREKEKIQTGRIEKTGPGMVSLIEAR